MEIIQLVTDSLGDASYVVVSGDEAAVVDPQRDVRPYVAVARERGARITRVFETHVHNDYISGGPELAARGAEIVAPADSGLEFAHRAVSDGDELAVGAARLRAVHAPGHTHHHTAYLAVDESGTVVGAFTGGSIIIGGAGRSDLLGPEHTEELTRAQWESAHRIASMLDGDVELLPTHGAGSFCSSQPSDGERRATLAEELRRNVVLTSVDYGAFRDVHLGNPAPIPAYYSQMAPTNRRGPHLYGEPPRPRPLEPDAVERARADGSYVLDVRSRFMFADAHVPGSVSIEESGAMLAYVGWVVPFNHELVLVAEDEAQADRVTTDLLRIGYERVRGFIPFAHWAAARESARLDVLTARETARVLTRGSIPVYDVRFESDVRELSLPGARHLPIDRLPEWLTTLERRRDGHRLRRRQPSSDRCKPDPGGRSPPACPSRRRSS